MCANPHHLSYPASPSPPPFLLRLLPFSFASSLSPLPSFSRSSLHFLGTRLFNAGQYFQAVVEFGEAINCNPKVATFHVHQGSAAFYLRDFRGARKR